MRRKLSAPQNAANVFLDGFATQLQRREIDRDAVPGPPCDGGLATLLDRPQAKRIDKAGPLRDGYENGGRQNTPCRVTPTGQRLAPRDGKGVGGGIPLAGPLPAHRLQ